VTIIVLLAAFLGAAIAVYHTIKISSISIDIPTQEGNAPLVSSIQGEKPEADVYADVKRISEAIAGGADAFLGAEYKYVTVFALIFAVVILVVIGAAKWDDAERHTWAHAGFATLAFVLGAATSIGSGFIGMKIAVLSNARVAVMARFGYRDAFRTAFKAGMVMGFGLVALGVVVLYVLMAICRAYFDKWNVDNEICRTLFESVAGYGLGGSTVALFGRVGGGIYTKAADVGADLSGKVTQGWEEDDIRNPAVIADNVGDNVGDIAGMGADLFGSLAESSCACMVVAASSPQLSTNWGAISLPLVLIAAGMLASFLTSFFITHFQTVEEDNQIEPALKRQLLVSTIIMTPLAVLVCYFCLPEKFSVNGIDNIKFWHMFICAALGLWSGLAIGYITEYFTSFAYTPVQECAEACQAGAAPNIIYGLALGYKSCIIPVSCLCVTIYVSYSIADMYGVAVAAIGILSTMATGLAIDAYGPICDNAGGIAEMAVIPGARDRTDALDAAGNTTAAIGKGFAIGSAALVSLALFGAYVTGTGLVVVNLLNSYTFAGLLFGAMIPYWFSALTMKSVGTAAFAMVREVERQLDPSTPSGHAIRAGQQLPDYKACVRISTEASLREMIAPGALVILTPIIVGFVMGRDCLAGLLAGNLVSGVQIAISASNTGGAWDNAKKLIKKQLGKEAKSSPAHTAAVIGDTVGDPLKDTSGPSINILIKLTAIISVVFARAFPPEGKALIPYIINKAKGK